MQKGRRKDKPMTTSPYRVLVVDDSAFARKVLREILGRDARLEVVGFARDGLDALEKIDELKPDVITLDLMMPELDGVGVLEVLATRKDEDRNQARPRVVVVTMTDMASEKGVAALAAGAFEVVHKPTALATDRLYELDRELIEKVVLAARTPASRVALLRGAGAVAAAKPTPPPLVIPTTTTNSATHATRLVVIGTSTGGPRALTEVLAALPASFPLPIAAVVHMPEGYTNAFAARLDAQCALHVIEADEGQRLEPGTVTLGRAGVHFRIRSSGENSVPTASLVSLSSRDRGDASIHRPSVDVLFESAVEALGRSVLGVVLTGMGNDGLAGARKIHSAGGQLIVEAESSCVVYGMPRAVAEANLGAFETPLDHVARAILDRI